MRSYLDRIAASSIALLLALCVVGLGCQLGDKPPEPSEAEPSESTEPSSVTETTSPEPGTTEEPEPAEPETAPPETPEPKEEAAPAPGGDLVPIGSTTKRTAAGLPDPIPGYQAWLRLGASATASAEAKSAHPPVRGSYVLLTLDDKVPENRTLSAPLREGTTIVLESKSPKTDFIESVSVMKKLKEGWEYFQYERKNAESAFAPSAGGTESCAACHDQAKDSDSVFSNLKLE